MQMERLKGLVERIERYRIVIVADRSNKEYYLGLSDMPGAEKGERVDMLIAPSDDEDGLAKIISIKSKKKIKPLKMPNFNTLVGHMLKTRDRLKATLAETTDSDAASELNDKIAWLDKGISLFS